MTLKSTAQKHTAYVGSSSGCAVVCLTTGVQSFPERRKMSLPLGPVLLLQCISEPNEILLISRLVRFIVLLHQKEHKFSIKG